ncbi:hypothetical protein [Methylocystis bryophila]|uniref:Uncharacterized protein n=1 Tax=Methylocystis bryophila TaxID=655015 RepID=A0A1W6MZV6_9HYPH|nr:hypothetical protein [Methylocystis bryophila]ARN83100.1 hypothetical protein B1812_20720 [Methylocystis bryophila]
MSEDSSAAISMRRSRGIPGRFLARQLAEQLSNPTLARMTMTAFVPNEADIELLGEPREIDHDESI